MYTLLPIYIISAQKTTKCLYSFVVLCCWYEHGHVMDTVVDGAMFIFNAIPICNLTLDENSFRFVYGDTIGAL